MEPATGLLLAISLFTGIFIGHSNATIEYQQQILERQDTQIIILEHELRQLTKEEN